MKVLQFSAYPISLPQHGGQLRAAAINRALTDAGIETTCIAAFDETHYPDRGESYFPIPHSDFARCANPCLCNLLISEVISSDAAVRDRLIDCVRRADADLYMFEQPWLWPLIRDAMSAEPGLRRPIVYSSQNVEAPLLEAILASPGGRLSPPDAEAVRKMEAVEQEIVETAELVLACTQGDVDTYRSRFRIGRTACFPNGINPPTAGTGELRERFAARFAHLRLAGFVGSAHPPNAEGFETMMGENFGYLPPDDRILVLGGVCDLLGASRRRNPYRALNESRCEYFGRIPQADLDALLGCCKVLLLPILTGGGSNLKTAEALVSGKTILSTSLAFRGYDAFRDFPTVNIVDDPKAWRRRLRDLLAADGLPRLTAEQGKKVESLLWVNILRDLPRCIRSVVS